MVSERLIPLVWNVMALEPDTGIPFMDSLRNALGHLAEGGSAQEQKLALAALGGEKNRNPGRAGNSTNVRATWCATTRSVDYRSQCVSFGSLHFPAVDMGGYRSIST